MGPHLFILIILIYSYLPAEGALTAESQRTVDTVCTNTEHVLVSLAAFFTRRPGNK